MENGDVSSIPLTYDPALVSSRIVRLNWRIAQSAVCSIVSNLASIRISPLVAGGVAVQVHFSTAVSPAQSSLHPLPNYSILPYPSSFPFYFFKRHHAQGAPSK
jgi:hypothetical protein